MAWRPFTSRQARNFSYGHGGARDAFLIAFLIRGTKRRAGGCCRLCVTLSDATETVGKSIA